MNKILVITGPTATGKTDLGIKFAQKLNGEIVSCDSRQLYKNLDIGTGKEPGSYSILIKKRGFWKVDGIKIWLYDIFSLQKKVSVKNYLDKARKVIEKISLAGKLPIIVGGTGLYLKALLEGLPNLGIPENKKLRKSLSKYTVGELQKALKILSPTRFNNLNQSDVKNPRRLIRQIELSYMYPYTTKYNWSGLISNYSILTTGLSSPLSILYSRIDHRILNWLKTGLIEEAKKLHRNGLSFKRMRQLGLEYSLLADYLEKKVDKKKLMEELRNKNHQYAKRQLTWFKKQKNISWFDITNKNFLAEVEKLVLDWYNVADD